MWHEQSGKYHTNGQHHPAAAFRGGMFAAKQPADCGQIAARTSPRWSKSLRMPESNQTRFRRSNRGSQTHRWLGRLLILFVRNPQIGPPGVSVFPPRVYYHQR
jgi:hypothetical protein